MANTRTDNKFGQKIPNFPVDEHGKYAPVLYGVIVDASGNIIKYLPIRCTDNGDGTCTPSVRVVP